MNMDELTQKLNNLLKIPYENEVVEYKEAKNDFDFNKMGKYFSALSNEANLRGKTDAWLILGVKDKDHSIIGTNYRINDKDLYSLKKEIADQTTNRITFIEIYPFNTTDNKRVVMFQVPAAPKGIPIAFKGHYYGRDGESLVALNLSEIERIRYQGQIDDWSAAIIPNADIDDLDTDAIQKARENFKKKFPDKSLEIDTWDDWKFLNKAKITIKDKITRTAIILLGKAESEHFISPSEIKIRWTLNDGHGNLKDFYIETCPILLAVDKIYSKIRIHKYRYLQEGTLFPDEIDQYDPFVIREAMNNCIAHQDYSKGGRINIVEKNDELIFTNLGNFIPGSIEKVVTQDAPEEFYRNRFLVTAMFNLGMVETAGGGIRKMFICQKERCFPIPEYDLSGDKVKVVITGKVLDMSFARALARNKNLSLIDIMLLDKIQKKKYLSPDEMKYLRSKNFIEGRSPNFHISSSIIADIPEPDLKAQYINQKGLDDEHCKELIIEYLRKFKKAKKRELENFLIEKLPGVLSLSQKKNKVKNLLTALRQDGKIHNFGYSEWSIKK